MSFWGGAFPANYWGGTFPLDVPVGNVQPTQPAGAGTFQLELEEGARVSYVWQTGIAKAYSGVEKRSNIVDDPAIRYEGTALLSDAATRAARSRLARYAAAGQSFLLGLPYEGIPIVKPTTTNVLSIGLETANYCDWCNPGQRVLVTGSSAGTLVATIQGVTITTIILDVTVGAYGTAGAIVMPAAAVFLDAQQGFQRYATKAERWSLRGRNATIDTFSAATYAKLELAAYTGTPALQAGAIVSRFPGTVGNGVTFELRPDGGSPGSLEENIGARTIVIHYSPGATPIGRISSLLAGSVYVQARGLAGITTKIESYDAFGPVALSGGQADTEIEVGRSVTLTQFAGRPVWDRGIDVDDTVGDSMQAMNDPMDLGGLPFTVQTAQYADWGRTLSLQRGIRRDWQWAKKFLWTVKGRWKSFWVPSMRPDLVPMAVGAGTLTVASGELNGDFFAWYPAQRSYLQTVSATGTATYVRIVGAVDNLNGSITLQLVNDAEAAVTLSGVPARVSWLERCRLESDQVDVTFDAFSFSLQMQARAVQQRVAEVSTTSFLASEASDELSRPREGIEFIFPTTTYRVGTGTRDVNIGGQTFRAYPSQREEIKLATIADTDDLVVQLPLAHDVAQRYLANATPPRRVDVVIRRLQVDSGITEEIWRGTITACAVDRKVVSFRVPSRAGALLAKRLPVVTSSKLCPHILYDANCRVSRASFEMTTTVTNVSGRVVTVASVGGNPDHWYQFGELTHVASGERMSIEDQAGTSVSMQLAILELKVGDSVKIAAGCAHDITTCRTKFSNKVNFGGFPRLNTVNPFKPTGGFGIYETT